MADDITLNAGSGGPSLKTFEDANAKHWQPAAVAYATAIGTPDAFQMVTTSAGLPVAQQGSWAVTANAGTGTFAVSAASLPLPTGAATAAKQPAIGTAGSASPDVITVQGIGGGTAIPVSGTFWQATQPVSIAAAVAVTDNAGSLTVDNGGTFPVQAAQSGTWTVTANAGTGTFAISAASLPLPAGAATAAKQPSLGTAGTPSADVLTVQGVASMTALKVDGSGVTQPVSGTFWQATQPVSLASLPALAAGTNNIGDVDVLTLPALASGTNLVGRISASNETDSIYSGSTALTPKFATISASSSGNTAVVPAVVGKKIRVLRWSVSSNGAVNVKFQRGTTDITGLYYLTQYASVGGGYCPVGHFETASNEALNINLSGAVAVGGVLTYCEV